MKWRNAKKVVRIGNGGVHHGTFNRVAGARPRKAKINVDKGLDYTYRCLRNDTKQLAQPQPISLTSTKTPAIAKLPDQAQPTKESATKTHSRKISAN